MKLQLRLAERKGLKSPGAMLAYLALGCVAVLGVLFWLFVWPPMKEYRDLIHQNEQMQQQLSTLFNRPKSTKLQEEDLKKLVGQIPTSPELGRFVLALREKERATGVSILSLSNQDSQTAANGQSSGQLAPGTKSQASIEPKLNGDSLTVDPAVSSYKSTTGNGTKPSTSGSNGTGGSGTQGNGSASGQPKLTTLKESKLQLSVSGTYEQAVRFVGELQQMERFTNVTEWSFVTAPGAVVGDHERLTLQIHISVYTAEQYAGKLPMLDPLNIPGGSNRTDPTLSEDALLKQLSP